LNQFVGFKNKKQFKGGKRVGVFVLIFLMGRENNKILFIKGQGKFALCIFTGYLCVFYAFQKLNNGLKNVTLCHYSKKKNRKFTKCCRAKTLAALFARTNIFTSGQHN
jgi:hypothetical protein